MITNRFRQEDLWFIEILANYQLNLFCNVWYLTSSNYIEALAVLRTLCPHSVVLKALSQFMVAITVFGGSD